MSDPSDFGGPYGSKGFSATCAHQRIACRFCDGIMSSCRCIGSGDREPKLSGCAECLERLAAGVPIDQLKLHAMTTDQLRDALVKARAEIELLKKYMGPQEAERALSGT